MCCDPSKLITGMLKSEISCKINTFLTHPVKCVLCCETVMHGPNYFLPDREGGGGDANWNGECPIRPIMGWGGLNCWAIRGWGPDDGGGACPTPLPPDPELLLEVLYWLPLLLLF